jgi:hypothetical protein
MIETAFCNQAKLDMMNGVHQPGDKYRLALYTDMAELGPETKQYTRAHEAEGDGYEIGGVSLSGRRAVLVRGAACLSFTDVIWPKCTVPTAGALIYNASRDNAALATISFGQTLFPTNGEFALDFPLPTPEAAVIVIL